MLKYLLLLMTFFLLAACDIFSIPEPDANQRPYEIFNAQESETLRLGIFTAQGRVDDYWTIAHTDVSRFQTSLLHYLEVEGHTNILERYADYQQQYFGYVIGDEQFIYGNFFCDVFGMDWRNNFVMVDDGGACFFQAIYNPLTDEIISLYINGEG